MDPRGGSRGLLWIQGVDLGGYFRSRGTSRGS